jgi:hypothetical protein
MSAIAGNDTIPDQYVLHLLGGRLSPVNDLQNAQPTFLSLLAEYGLPERQINVNEYATTIEQRPAGGFPAWSGIMQLACGRTGLAGRRCMI